MRREGEVKPGEAFGRRGPDRRNHFGFLNDDKLGEENKAIFATLRSFTASILYSYHTHHRFLMPEEFPIICMAMMTLDIDEGLVNDHKTSTEILSGLKLYRV